jgi:hypothetical protein
MQKSTLFMILFISILLNSCSKSESETPEPQIAQLIIGTYNLNKLTKGTADVTALGTGNAVISAVNNTTTSIKLNLKVGNLSQETTSNYQISKNGTDYVVKDNDGINTIGAVSGNKLTMSITVFSFSGTSDTYSAVFVK